ncbi:hypothetical protein HY497_01955 [Candidatus Woesearchaeota archaeon]|nr:hypothetical protein [Candidatus Woesearchaeota archaeon]
MNTNRIVPDLGQLDLTRTLGSIDPQSKFVEAIGPLEREAKRLGAYFPPAERISHFFHAVYGSFYGNPQGSGEQK